MLFKKSLGQHFLIDENIQKKIVNLLEIDKNDTVLEIGPGQGALTKHIYGNCKKLILIEKDKKFGNYLKNIFPNAEVIIDDFLKLDFIYKDKLKIIGNLPYNVASQIILKIISSSSNWFKAVFMVQKEVAKRIVASNGTKDYSILSVIVQTFSTVNIEFDVSPSCFLPKPKVVSSVITLKPLESGISNFDSFFTFTKALFYGRRKKLVNVLKNNPFLYFEKKFIDLVVNEFGEDIRIENLSIEKIKKLYQEGDYGIKTSNINKKKHKTL